MIVDLATLVLATGTKAILQNSAYLLGVPLIAIGALFLVIALSPFELRWPQPINEADLDVLEDPPEGHSEAAEYIKVGIFLAAVTALEVALYYMNLADGALLGMLLALSALKFVLVVLWFMHLKFDSRLFSVTFTAGIVLAAGLFTVVLATLGSSLV